jgi:hypothetical protein
MKHRVGTLQICAATAGWAALSVGCYSPSLYQTPRTLDPGQFASVVAAEPAAMLDVDSSNRVVILPRPFPSPIVVGRYGLAKRIEVSGSIAPISPRVGAVMLKVQVLRTAVFDAALLTRLGIGFVARTTPLNPECEGPYCTARFQLEPALIAMLGFNFSRATTLVIAPGIVRPLVPDAPAVARLSVGFQWRLTRELAIHPEVTYVPTPLGLPSLSAGWFGGIGIVARGGDGYP